MPLPLRLPAGLDLPIRSYLPEIVATLGKRGVLVLAAEPGAGKTSLVPLALAEAFPRSGRIIVIEPRRVATVAAAARLAELDGTAIGDRVGYRVRGDSRVGRATRIEVVTGGVFVRMIQSDPSLEGIGTIVFDEFHERSLDTDLGLALALEARELRGGAGAAMGGSARGGASAADGVNAAGATSMADGGRGLSLLVMSATLDLARVAAHLGAPTISVPGRSFPIETRYAAQVPRFVEDWVAASVLEALASGEGDILAFLPGMAEIVRTESALLRDGALRGMGARGLEILRLHGSLPLEEQRRVIALPAGDRSDSPRRVILATSIAETSLTVPRVTTVVDSGLARSQRFDQRSGLNRLVTSREARDRADQRRGRAGRLGPGLCLRAWAEGEVLVERTSPEILVADLSGLVLETLVWGARKRLDLPWLDAPPEAAWKAGEELLRELGGLDKEGRVTARGRIMATLGTEPRLAALVLEGREREAAGSARGSGWVACVAAALLGEGGSSGDSNDFSRSVIEAVEGRGSRPGAARSLDEARRLASRSGVEVMKGSISTIVEGELAGLVAAAWPDRVARRETFTGTQATFALPAGRQLKAMPPLAASPWILALDADAGEALGRVYSGLALDEVTALEALRPLVEEVVDLQWKGRSYRARRNRRAGALILSSTAAGALSRETVATALVQRLAREGFACLLPDPKVEAWLARLGWWLRAKAGPDAPSFEAAALAAEAKDWLAPFVDADPTEVLPGDSLRQALESRLGAAALRAFGKEAPATLTLPSGRSRPILYDEGPSPLIESRVSDFFGLAVHPTIGGIPLVLRLLSPAGRPVQVTADLPGFWKGAWSEARKELRGRYPKHDWPEHPETASPPAPNASRGSGRR